MKQSRQQSHLVMALVVFIGILPILLIVALIIGTPSLTAQNALRTLSDPSSNSILVDVRQPDEFRSRHLIGASNWPLEQILDLNDASQIPSEFQQKTLLVICESGIMSVKATRKLRSLEQKHIYNVLGGMEAWTIAGGSPAVFVKLDGSKQFRVTSFRTIPLSEQLAAMISGLVFKPIYMVLSLLLAIVLHKELAHDLVALRWGLFIFFIGEAFCSVNYLVFHDNGYWPEYLHSYGMVVAFGFIIYAILDGLDSRLIHYSDPRKRCSMSGLCSSCIKNQNVTCRGRQLILTSIPMLSILVFLPLIATPKSVAYQTLIFGTSNNYIHSYIFQFFEMRYCPLVALGLFAAAFILLAIRPNWPAPKSIKLLIAGGIGAFGFGIFRLVFASIFGDKLAWTAFWEELTELLFISAVALVLWIFRSRLFSNNNPLSIINK